MFEFGDGEEYDFAPTEASKLASLFGASILQIPNETDLTYTAPKQPTLDHKDGQNDSKILKQPNTKVLLVKVINLWKLEDKTYKSLGKHGLGLIGSADLKTQELIAYKSKDSVILRAKVSEKFLFFIQKDNFSSFHDNDLQNWLVKFENNDQIEFSNVIKSYGGRVIDSTKESAAIIPKNTETDKPKPDLLPKPQNLGTGDQESDSSEKRTNILNRISKLGQQTVLRPISTASDASDHEEITKSRKHRKAKKGTSEKAKIKEENRQLEQLPIEGHQQLVRNELALNNLVGVPSTSYPMWVTHQPDISNYLLTQNLDLKQTLATISSKLDSINNPKPSNDNSTLVSKLKALEVKAENLEATAECYKQKYEELEVKYLDLLNKDNNRLLESSLLITNLEGQISTLKLQLEVANEGVTELKKQSDVYENAQIMLKEYEETIEDQKVRLTELEQFYEQNKDFTEKKEAINSLGNVVNDLNQRLKAYEDKLTASELEREHLRQQQDLTIRSIGNLIKISMNEMYQNILSNFNEDYSYTYSELKSPIAENMKGATLNLIENITERLIVDQKPSE